MSVRVDKWLWSVRVFKSRSQATAACSAGRVTVNDHVAKAATRVGPGDVVRTRRRDRIVVYAVVEAISKRAGPARAVECYEDRSPPRERHAPTPHGSVPERDPGAGRPTKRDRRRIDRLRRR